MDVFEAMKGRQSIRKFRKDAVPREHILRMVEAASWAPTAGNAQNFRFLVVQDNFLTPTARFADIVLPACTQLETWGVEDGWKYGDEVLLMPKIVEPLSETRSDYRICAEIAKRLGIGLRTLHRKVKEYDLSG